MNLFYNNVQNCIRTIQAIDLIQTDASQQVRQAWLQFSGIRHFEVTFKKGSCIYRCRPNENVDFFDHVDELKYPAASKISLYGRCNLPEQSVFYASKFEWNSFIELMHALDKRIPDNRNAPVTVGEWIVQEDLEMVVVLITIDYSANLVADVSKILQDNECDVHFNLHGSAFWEVKARDPNQWPNPSIYLTAAPHLDVNS